MRGAAAHSKKILRLDLGEFGWDLFTVATARHSTLPWHDGFDRVIDIAAAPLAQVRGLGERDRLSLVGQFAAHQAFLRFAGIDDGPFALEQWGVAIRRAADCRLIRLRATPSEEDEPPPAVTLIESFAAAIGAPVLRVLERSWARPEAIYAEVDLRLRSDAAADLRWLHAAAAGRTAAPGRDMLRSLFAERFGRFTCGDPAVVASIDRAAVLQPDHVVVPLGGEQASPLRRYSAIEQLDRLVSGIRALEESEIAERVAEALDRTAALFVAGNARNFDSASRRVLQMLSGFNRGVWVLPERASSGNYAWLDAIALPSSAEFAIAPTAVALRTLEQRISCLPAEQREPWLREFVAGEDFGGFLHHGRTPPDHLPFAVESLEEPRRSCLAALAIVGQRVPLAAGREMLARLGAESAIEELCAPGVATLEHGELVISPAAHAALAAALPADFRKELSVAAGVQASCEGDRIRAAALFIRAGETRRGLEELQRSGDWPAATAAEVVAILDSVPTGELTGWPALTFRVGLALVDAGRYTDALQLARLLPQPQQTTLMARAERRTGDYGAALQRLEQLDASQRDFGAELLRAELRRLQQLDPTEALVRCQSLVCSPEDAVRHGYERAIHAIETFQQADEAWLATDEPITSYLASRYRTYQAIEADEPENASAHAAESVRRATTVTQQIDARMDQLFALFLSGRWDETRLEGLSTLALVDETQGDRAAGGILFTLAYLAADEGQWTAAAHRIERLRGFYRGKHDARRLREIALLEAHLALGRAEFAEARSLARTLLQEAGISLQLREAAQLIVDEIDWIEGRLTAVHTSGCSRCRELADRHWINVARLKGDASQIEGTFSRQLASWEQSMLRRVSSDPPTSQARSQRLRLTRSAWALGRRLDDQRLARMAADLARELDIVLPLPQEAQPGSVALEGRVLRIAALRDFPFAPDDFDGLRWVLANRNRLGQWNQIGSLPLMDADSLDRIAAGPLPEGWMECDEREFLYFEGSSHWSVESREAVRRLFRTRSEHHRLKRVMEQEQTLRTPATTAIDGIIGDSLQMKEVFALVGRIARREVPICVFGESGTGKELIARAIHRGSSRRSKSFVAINCAALPENLVESELFGHSRGAFTGADRDRPGLIETSDGGTLFLDEIGEMPLPAQAKLLRFLHDGEFRRVGETTTRIADVRVIAATNRSLEHYVDEKAFRQDLYYRIRGVEIVLPPLRERASDISALANHFLAKEYEHHRSGPRRLSAEVEAIFRTYPWPGNVRELQNTIRAAHAMAAEESELMLEHLPPRMQSVVAGSIGGTYQQELVRFRRALIERSLRESSGNQNQAAKRLGMSRQALAYQIRELGILVRESS